MPIMTNGIQDTGAALQLLKDQGNSPGGPIESYDDPLDMWYD